MDQLPGLDTDDVYDLIAEKEIALRQRDKFIKELRLRSEAITAELEKVQGALGSLQRKLEYAMEVAGLDHQTVEAELALREAAGSAEKTPEPPADDKDKTRPGRQRPEAA